MIGTYRDWEKSQALPNAAREQGYKLLSHHSNHMEQSIVGYMEGHEEEFIWSQRLGVWFVKGTSPDAAKEALRQRKMKDQRADAFNRSFNGKQDAKSAQVLVLKLKSEGLGLRPHEWKLGPGPCGRTVLGLKVDRVSMPGWLVVWQWCEDEPSRPDEFCYPLDDIAALRIYQTGNPHPAKQTCG
ncbi:hypothetical protein [Delftia phage IME-DE1]|uniref:Uncharacterized protein n=1 Tax=Delftia phage IME-DE1 TaxID=1647385 RepID=A0A0F7ILP9_9CAUD|nr:hypothetical protein AU155_gp23 [Delftia phage IME-DE1]AKG94486.1 hypothetical protein [Delftia phage IME-DE1]